MKTDCQFWVGWFLREKQGDAFFELCYELAHRGLPMEDKAATAADAIELILLNQHAIRAAIEELSLWVGQRGSTTTHDNVLTALEAIDMNSESIRKSVEALRE